MNEPFIFRVSDCYYIQASYPSPAEHRHFAAHLVFAMERPFTALVNGVSVEAAGIAIGSDVPHTILSEAPTLVVFIDELTPMSRCVKHTLLRGAPWRTLDTSVSSTSVSSEVGERWRDVRTEADAAAAAAETERLLGLQEQRTSAEDPRILEAAAYMKATPALEQLTIQEVAQAVHLSPSRLTHLFRRDIPAGYGNLPPSLSGKPEAGTGLLSAGDGTLPHPGLHGCGLCHSLPHGGHQPEVVRYVHDRGEADFPGRPGPDQNSR